VADIVFPSYHMHHKNWICRSGSKITVIESAIDFYRDCNRRLNFALS